jgi:hypothetical protein
MTCRPDLITLPAFRCATADQVDRVLVTPANDRVPKYVPLSVDNLWEWRRPAEFPSRRSCAFASPTPELASRSGPSGGVVCRVLVRPPCRVVQLVACPDARDHPDVAFVERVLVSVDREHPGAGAQLDRPLMAPDDVERVVSAWGQAWQRSLAGGIRIWSTARALPVERGGSLADEVGELFFEAPSGYVLRPAISFPR